MSVTKYVFVSDDVVYLYKDENEMIKDWKDIRDSDDDKRYKYLNDFMSESIKEIEIQDRYRFASGIYDQLIKDLRDIIDKHLD